MRELILAIGIGVLTGSGVWLLLRPRTFQVIIGLSLIGYGVNLFIFSMGRLRVNASPILTSGTTVNPADYERYHQQFLAASTHWDERLEMYVRKDGGHGPT